MIQIPPPPTHSDVGSACWWRRDQVPQRRLNEQPGEIDPGVHGQLQGAPESSIYLHQICRTRSGVSLELDHRRAAPLEGGEQGFGLRDERRIGNNAFGVDADSAGGRLFADAAVRECGERLVVPAKKEHAGARAFDACLQQDGECRRRKRLRQNVEFRAIPRPRNAQFHPASRVTTHGTARLHHDRPGQDSRSRRRAQYPHETVLLAEGQGCRSMPRGARPRACRLRDGPHAVLRTE